MILIYILACSEATQNPSGLPVFQTINLRVNAHKFEVPFAKEPHEVALGLRYQDIHDETGMLLAVEGGELSMSGLTQPVAAAFLSDDGTITDILLMEIDSPNRDIGTSVSFILEMHSTWFSRHNVEANMQVFGLPEDQR